MFWRRDELAYLHNAVLVVGGRGRASGLGRGGCWEPSSLDPRAALEVSLDFNSSSIAVSAHVASVAQPLLKSLRRSLDTALYAAALRAGGLLCHLGEPLTHYREHGGPRSSASGLHGLRGLEEWAGAYSAVLRDYEADYKAALALAPRVSGAQVIRHHLLRVRLELALLRGLGGHALSPGDYVALLRSAALGLRLRKAHWASAVAWPLTLTLRKPLIKALRRGPP